MTRTENLQTGFALVSDVENYMNEVTEIEANQVQGGVGVFVYRYACASMSDGSVGYCTIVSSGYHTYYYGPS